MEECWEEVGFTADDSDGCRDVGVYGVGREECLFCFLVDCFCELVLGTVLSCWLVPGHGVDYTLFWWVELFVWVRGKECCMEVFWR